MAAINSLDLAFVVDTTGSMGSLIAAAQSQMTALLRAASQAADVDLQLGVVQYRDHPPQDKLVKEVFALTGDLKKAQRNIDSLKADGGGDAPEAVLDGVFAMCRELKWRRHAARIAVLIGDAPPHGVGVAGDAFPKGCPCGQTIDSVTVAAEETRVRLYSVGLTPSVKASFTSLATLTGGEFFPAAQANEAISRLENVVKAEFGNLDVDRCVLAEWERTNGVDVDTLADVLKKKPSEVAAAVMRLRMRELIEIPEAERIAPVSVE